MIQLRWFVSAGLILVLAMPLRSVADVTVTAISQGATTHYSHSSSGGIINQDDDTISFSQIPPGSFSLSSGVAGIGTYTVHLDVSAYTGPSSIGVPAPGLTFAGSTGVSTAGSPNNGSPSSIFLSMNFTLDVPQPYTYTHSGFGAKLFGPGGGVELPSGSGTLAAGNYSLSLFLSPPSSMSLNVLPVPEPGMLTYVAGIGTLWACRRGRLTR